MSFENSRRMLAPPKAGARVAAVVVSAMSGVTDHLIRIATLSAAKDRSYKNFCGIGSTTYTDGEITHRPAAPARRRFYR